MFRSLSGLDDGGDHDHASRVSSHAADNVHEPGRRSHLLSVPAAPSAAVFASPELDRVERLVRVLDAVWRRTQGQKEALCERGLPGPVERDDRVQHASLPTGRLQRMDRVVGLVSL